LRIRGLPEGSHPAGEFIRPAAPLDLEPSTASCHIVAGDERADPEREWPNLPASRTRREGGRRLGLSLYFGFPVTAPPPRGSISWRGNRGGHVAPGPAIILAPLRRSLAAPALAGQPDGALLRLFAAGGPAACPAFETLLRRHGPLVWRACRAALRDANAAEDAFQATFLVLVRRAGSLRHPDALGPWLFGVARRVAARARADAARRQVVESRACVPESVSACGPEPDVAGLVHDAVGGLPEALRAAVVLCDLQGLSYQEAANQLGWTHATLRGRLARARE